MRQDAGAKKEREARRQRLLKELRSLEMIIRGSYLERYNTCVRPGCECHQGRKHGPRGSVTTGNPQKQHYVPEDQKKAVQRGVAGYQQLMRVVEDLTEIYLELMKERKLK